MSPTNTTSPSKTSVHPKHRGHYRELLWHTLSRQLLLYFIPLLLLAVFFHIQYRQITAQSQQAHLEVLAEHQAATLSLFLRERQTNLANVIDDPDFRKESTRKAFLDNALEKLRMTSDAFIDLGVVDGSGMLREYAGPVQFLAPVNYSGDVWFQNLLAPAKDAVITDVYLGFRNLPHFTIAVKRKFEGRDVVLRSALSPEKINAFISTLEGAQEVHASVINASGVFQVVTPKVGIPLKKSPYQTPQSPLRGYVPATDHGSAADYAYSWLGEVPWTLIVEDAKRRNVASFMGMPSSILLITVCVFVFMGIVIIIRARQVVRKQLAHEKTEAELSGQLAQAAKLASVGELAAGIAHEINNPLAIIAEEVGVLKDSLDPTLPEDDEPLDQNEHLDIIHQAVFRCRDITRKLLTFVRKTDIRIEPHHPHDILNEVIEGMLGNEIMMANIEVKRRFDARVQTIMTDRNQLVQVIVNIVKNAIDAMSRGGLLTVRTIHEDEHLVIGVIDTGCGMSREQLESAFVPFFTTKEPGKGTGLGLSVSFSIIKNFGGDIYIESEPDKGTTITVMMPYAVKES